MSRDQKPGKVRVVGGGAVPQRRRDDVGPEASEPVVAATPVDGIDDASRKPGRMLPLLFVSGCAIGGAALPLMRAL